MGRETFADLSSTAYLYEAIKKQYPHLIEDTESSIFQFIMDPQEATWQKGADMQAVSLIDTTPDGCSGFYRRGAASISSGYRNLLNCIEMVDPSKNPRIMELNRSIESQRNSLKESANDLWVEYQKLPAVMKKKSFEDWLESGGSVTNMAVEDTMGKIRELKKELNDITVQMRLPLEEAKTRYAQDEMKYVDDNGKEVTAKSMYITESILAAKQKWDSPSGAEGFKVEIKRDDRVEDKVKSTYDIKSHVDLWGAKVSGSYDSSQLIKDENYHLSVTAAAVKSFQIKRGDWYADEFVDKTKPFVEGCSLTHDNFFDKQSGSLHLIPTSVLVIYRPKIVMTITSTVYEKSLKSKMHGGVGFYNLFGMSFDMDAGASMKVVEENAVTSITFDSPVNVEPQLLGILSVKKY